MNKQARSDVAKLSIVQIALNVSDLPGSLQFYNQVFGFKNAGGNMLWGNVMAMQGLDTSGRAHIWWMVGGVPHFQIEFFHHTKPAQRPQPADWRPSDHGWVRFGLHVSNFNQVADGLKQWDVPLIGGPVGGSGKRRLTFRDPFAGAIVEAIESDAGTCPKLAYATCSMPDMARARHLYSEVIGAALAPLESLHTPDDEALWGLPGAKREGFLTHFGDTAIEVVSYSNPAGRPRPADHCTVDQGIMNLAIGSRDPEPVRALIKRLQADGRKCTAVADAGQLVGTYCIDPECEYEIFASPEDMDATLGFVPAAPFIAEFAPKTT
jgi:catechol 2,3-dioxygenase-like lactoylglutathione lyase family enzyme